MIFAPLMLEMGKTSSSFVSFLILFHQLKSQIPKWPCICYTIYILYSRCSSCCVISNQRDDDSVYKFYRHNKFHGVWAT